MAESEDSAQLIPNAYVEHVPESGPSTISDHNTPLLTSIILRFFKKHSHQTFHIEFSYFFPFLAPFPVLIYMAR